MLSDNMLKKEFGYKNFTGLEAGILCPSLSFDAVDRILRSNKMLWREYDEILGRWLWRFNAICDLAPYWVSLFGSRAVTIREVLTEVMSEPVFLEDIRIRDILLYPSLPQYWGQTPSNPPISVDVVNGNLQWILEMSAPFGHLNAPSLTPYRLRNEVREDLTYWSMVSVPSDEDRGYPDLNRFLEEWERLYGILNPISFETLEGAEESGFKSYMMDWRRELQIRGILSQISGIEVNGRLLDELDYMNGWMLERVGDTVENYSGVCRSFFYGS